MSGSIGARDGHVVGEVPRRGNHLKYLKKHQVRVARHVGRGSHVILYHVPTGHAIQVNRGTGVEDIRMRRGRERRQSVALRVQCGAHGQGYRVQDEQHIRNTSSNSSYVIA